MAEVVVNGKSRSLVEVGGHVTLLDWLRGDGLTGSKEGCAEGECGACAVMVVRPDGDQSRWTAINACLVPAAGFDGQEVVTAEGLGRPGALHPVQQEMAVRGGSQCGYCTPGFVCSMASEFYRPDRRPAESDAADSDTDPRASDGDPNAPQGGHAADLEHGPNGFDLHALSGNLCRCTGYRPIRDAAYALGLPRDSDPLAARCTQPAPPPSHTTMSSSRGDFVRPLSLAEALAVIAERPDAQVVAGSTDWGVDLNLKHSRAALSVGIDRLPELRALDVGDDAIEIGAALTLTEIERGLSGRVPLLAELFPQFASRLIRNGATLGGNLGTGSPIGDSPPVLLALRASLVLTSTDGERTVELADYFTGYRQSVKRAGELIKTVRIPLPLAPLSAFHKIAKRRFDDISSVAIAHALRLDGDRVAEVTIGLGGVAATPIRATATEEALVGRAWNAATVRMAAEILGREGTPLDDHRASAVFRAAMLRQSLRKFYVQNPATPEEAAS
jgi:xanthine dehydrogenase small subunit